jgi:hypothetical protein
MVVSYYSVPFRCVALYLHSLLYIHIVSFVYSILLPLRGYPELI